jgi:peroxiredoxin
MPGPYGGQSQQRWGDNTINSNEYLRDIMLTDLSGRPTGTADARRKGMLILAFFDASSPASLSTLPYLQKLADAYKESGKLTVIGIAQNDRQSTKDCADKLGLKFPLLLDHDLYYSMVYGLAVVPTVFLADNTGLVIKKTTGHNIGVLNQMSAKIAEFAGVPPVDLTAPLVPATPAAATV